ncbi:hypothetical protein [Thauera sp.]|jgi:hypothetical protein|uniref:hypothetical protein n=1 Tax=Thauera sp. TaxID=1905334 RepID=UPI002A35B36F|nr:hypothetical protein [Thauera sp.]MDX9885748.1 hypothetical protein [Thauera sp.]
MPTCPRCDGTDCRESPWRSEDEKREHKGEIAWRCMSCVHRFFGPAPRSVLFHNPIVAAVGGSTLILTIVVIAIVWIWKS